MFEDEDFISEPSPASNARTRAVELFRRAYEAQEEKNYEEAVELYRRSIETYPTAEAHTFLGWVYSFDGRYSEAIDECLAAIRVDATLDRKSTRLNSSHANISYAVFCLK